MFVIFYSRGDCHYHKRGSEGPEHRSAAEDGCEDEAGCGMHSRGGWHGHCGCPSTHPTEDQGVWCKIMDSWFDFKGKISDFREAAIWHASIKYKILPSHLIAPKPRLLFAVLGYVLGYYISQYRYNYNIAENFISETYKTPISELRVFNGQVQVCFQIRVLMVTGLTIQFRLLCQGFDTSMHRIIHL